jgi:hypothetical protein
VPHSASSMTLPAGRWFRAALFLGVLAILTGFLGMHVLASSHAQHGPGAVTGISAGTHASHAPPSTAAAPKAQAALAHGPAQGTAQGTALNPASARPMGSSAPEPPPSCVSYGETGEMSVQHASCVPAPATAGLSAPPPGTSSFAGPEPAVAASGALCAYTYAPASPTPGELSIRRT